MVCTAHLTIFPLLFTISDSHSRREQICSKQKLIKYPNCAALRKAAYLVTFILPPRSLPVVSERMRTFPSNLLLRSPLSARGNGAVMHDGAPGHIYTPRMEDGDDDDGGARSAVGRLSF